MRIEYELTYADAAEAQTILQAAASKFGRLGRVVNSMSLVGILVVYGVLFAVVMRSANRSPAIHTVFLPMASWVMILIFSVTVIYARSLLKPQKPWEAAFSVIRVGRRRRIWLNLALRAVMLAIGLGLAYASSMSIWSSSPYVAHGKVETLDLFALGYYSALTVFGFCSLWAGIFDHIRVTSAAARRAAAHLNMHYVAQANEAGVTVESPHVRSEYAWQAFAGFLETRSLILLFTSPDVFVTLPKRAFGDSSEMDEFCATISRQIAAGRLLPRQSCFPVIAKAAPAGELQ